MALCRSAMPALLLALALVLACTPARSDDQCPAPNASDEGQISGFTVVRCRPGDAAAFQQDLQPLITASRAEKGNRGYFMYTNPKDPGAIGFVEGWKDVAALQTHLQSPHVTGIFGLQYFLELKSAPSVLYGPWKEVADPKCNTSTEEVPIEMVFYWTMNCTKKHVWDVITNWNDASWVHGHPKTKIVPLDKNGKPMSDEEAEKKGYVDPEGGLGPVVQRRTFANGAFVDVRMLSKDEDTFTTVQETLSALVFPTVAFEKFFVTLTLDSEGLDADTESRLRYHVRATVKKGTNDEARHTLKSDFYGPRIAFYQEYFNCSAGVQVKRAEKTISTLHSSLLSSDRLSKIPPLFEAGCGAETYLARTVGEEELPAGATVEVKLAFPAFAIPDLRVVAVEDVIISSLAGTSVQPRIVIYALNVWGRIVSTRVFDEVASGFAWFSTRGRAGRKLTKATENYYDTLEMGDIEKVRRLYAEDAVLEDPVGFAPPRTFDSVYGNFYRLADSFVFKRAPLRSFVDTESMQTAQMIDATFQVAGGGGELKTAPVQIITFDKQGKISKFEAFFRPRKVDFSKL